MKDSISSMSSSKPGTIADDLSMIRKLLLKFDVKRNFADMRRVECAGASLWTTQEGADDIHESSQSYGFKEALEIQSTLEAELKNQEEQIAMLREQVERLSFRKELNLHVPEDLNPTVASDRGIVYEDVVDADLYYDVPAVSSSEVEASIKPYDNTCKAGESVAAKKDDEASECIEKVPGSSGSSEGTDEKSELLIQL